MRKNKLIVLALAGLILAVAGIGSASAAEAIFDGGLYTVDNSQGTFKVGDTYGTKYVMYTDTVGWKNDFYNQLGFWQYGSAGYSCSELSISPWHVTIPAYTDTGNVIRSGSLGGNPGTYGIYSINHIYYGNSPAHVSPYNGATPTFNEYRW